MINNHANDAHTSVASGKIQESSLGQNTHQVRMKIKQRHTTRRPKPVVQPHASASASAVVTMPATLPIADINLVGGVRLSKWRKAVGLSRTSVWRLTKSGRLPVGHRQKLFLSGKFHASDPWRHRVVRREGKQMVNVNV
jgi:hypothetical protein